MSNTKPTTRLPRTGIFSGTNDRTMATFEALAQPENLSEGEILFEQGDEGDSLYFIESGSLEVSVLSSQGRKLYLELMRAGDIFGEIALLSPGERTATVIAREDTQLQRIARSFLVEACLDDPHLGLEVAGIAGRRLRWISTQFHEQVFLPLPARLARKLLHLVNEDDPTLRMSQNDLADFIGATREAVSKTLKHWEHDDVITLGRQKVIVDDFAALQALSDIDLI